MNTTSFLRRRCVYSAILISGLGLFGVAVFNATAGAEEKRNPKRAADKMVEAIVNRNKPPKLVGRPRDSTPSVLALYPESYDWKEEERVRKAIAQLQKDTSAESWEELLRRAEDPRYCVVIASEKRWNAEIRTVGEICARLAYSRLAGVFRPHMPPRGPDTRPLSLDLDEIGDLRDWRKERANKPLYQLHIEVGEMALRQLSKLKNDVVPKDEINAARKAIKAELEKLRRSKRPIALRESFPFPEYLYSEKGAKRVREAVQRGSSEDIDIDK